MSVFSQAFAKVIQHEGDYVNDPADPGGETRYGISKRSYPDLDIARLTLERARSIYFSDFWLRPHFDKVRHAPLAIKLFDLGVNLGTGHIIRRLQQAVNDLTGDALKVDGLLGPKTLEAVNNYPHPAALLAALKLHAGAYYLSLAKATERRFLAGWLIRLDS